MRCLYAILFLFLAAGLSATDRMYVKVRTVDAHIVEVICIQENTGAPPVPLRTIVRNQGSYSWHVSGGTPPYSLLEECVTDGFVKVVVMDGKGTIAEGTGVIGSIVIRDHRDCSGESDMITVDAVQVEQPEDEEVGPARSNTARPVKKADGDRAKEQHPRGRYQGPNKARENRDRGPVHVPPADNSVITTRGPRRDMGRPDAGQNGHSGNTMGGRSSRSNEQGAQDLPVCRCTKAASKVVAPCADGAYEERCLLRM